MSRLVHAQLSRLGNNLNQMVRHLHQTGDPLPTDLEHLLKGYASTQKPRFYWGFLHFWCSRAYSHIPRFDVGIGVGLEDTFHGVHGIAGEEREAR